jgi:hypothetical protein
MPNLKNAGILILALSIILLGASCTVPQNYARLVPANKPEYRTTIKKLIEDFQGYDVYFSGTKGEPTALLFDPRAEDKTLLAKDWGKVESQKELEKYVAWIRTSPASGWTYAILAPDGRFFGYLYTGRQNGVVVKVVDDKTLQAYGIRFLSELGY